MSTKTETLSLFDIPKVYFEKEFEETEQGDIVNLTHNIKSLDKDTTITLELYKRFIYCPNKKDTSVFDRERYYHPGLSDKQINIHFHLISIDIRGCSKWIW